MASGEKRKQLPISRFGKWTERSLHRSDLDLRPLNHDKTFPVTFDGSLSCQFDQHLSENHSASLSFSATLTSILQPLRFRPESVAWLVLAAVFKTVETSQGVWWVQFPPSPPILSLFLQALMSRATVGLPLLGFSPSHSFSLPDLRLYRGVP